MSIVEGFGKYLRFSTSASYAESYLLFLFDAVNEIEWPLVDMQGTWVIPKSTPTSSLLLPLFDLLLDFCRKTKRLLLLCADE